MPKPSLIFLLIVTITMDLGCALPVRAEEPSQRCQISVSPLDLNKEELPHDFIFQVHCALRGRPPSVEFAREWSTRLSNDSRVRRIDVARAICRMQSETVCSLRFEVPAKVRLLDSPPLAARRCEKRGRRDLGTLMMTFFECPKPTNCTVTWANTHPYGMTAPHPFYGKSVDPRATGYLNRDNPAFWLREFNDMVDAGFQFAAVAVYGTELFSTPDAYRLANEALEKLDGKLRVAMFLDTWAWGKSHWGGLMSPAPDLNNTEGAARRIYDTQIKPFFQGIERRHWYFVNGRALIYFYHAGTLQPRARTGELLEVIARLFKADFGASLFILLDRGYGDHKQADATFTWYTLAQPDKLSRSRSVNGVSFANFIPKWDTTGRDEPGKTSWEVSSPVIKDETLLLSLLQRTRDDDVVLIATWNDFGEGTGVARNFDYYIRGQWRSPDFFMRIIRSDQCKN